MSRIPGVTERDQVAEDKRHIWDEIIGSRGSVRGPFKVLMHSPELAGRIAHTGAYIRFESGLEAHVREMGAMITARVLDCNYEYGAHEGAARALGTSEATLTAIRERKPDGLPDDVRWIYDLVEQLVDRHRITPETFAIAQEHLGVAGLVELVGTIGYYAMIAAPLNAFEVEWNPA